MRLTSKAAKRPRPQQEHAATRVARRVARGLAPLPAVVGAALVAARTDRRRLAARADLAEEALARVQERDHELRATLSSLRLSHQLLVDRKATLSRATRWRLQCLHTAELERAERLLSARPADEVTTVPLAEVLDPLIDVMALQGCAVRWGGTGSQVRGRADDITEIAHILLQNAARHGAGNEVELAVTPGDGCVDVRVRDGGPGIPPALTPVVFDRGVRADDSEGEGLGLHVARRLAHDLSGDLWLEPRPPDGGAEFVLRLPEATGQQPCLAPAV